MSTPKLRPEDDPETSLKPVLKSASSSTLPVLEEDSHSPPAGSDGTVRSSEDKKDAERAAKERLHHDVESVTRVEDAKTARNYSAEKSPPAPVEVVKQGPGLLVTNDFLKVVAECREKVQTIAKECRANNTKYRFV